MKCLKRLEFLEEEKCGQNFNKRIIIEYSSLDNRSVDL